MIGVRMVAAGIVWAATTAVVAVLAAGAVLAWSLSDRMEVRR